MSKNKGHIKLNRRFFDNFLWSEARTFSKAEAWIDLIQSARFEASTEIINGKVIELQRGELAASRRFLELRWNWGSSKVSNFLKILTDLGMINQRKYNGQTILTLVKYSVYNDSQTNDKPQTKPTTNQRQTNDKPTANQNKEYKEREEREEDEEYYKTRKNEISSTVTLVQRICMKSSISENEFAMKLNEFFEKQMEVAQKWHSRKDLLTHFESWMSKQEFTRNTKLKIL